MFSGLSIGTELVIYALVALISPLFTHAIWKSLNKNGVEHAFVEIRFEHWAIAQYSFSVLMIGLIVLDRLVDKLEAALPLDSWLQTNVFLFYLVILIISTICLFGFLKHKLRTMNADLRESWCRFLIRVSHLPVMGFQVPLRLGLVGDYLLNRRDDSPPLYE